MLQSVRERVLQEYTELKVGKLTILGVQKWGDEIHESIVLVKCEECQQHVLYPLHAIQKLIKYEARHHHPAVCQTCRNPKES